jgi:hypothetical protein
MLRLRILTCLCRWYHLNKYQVCQHGILRRECPRCDVKGHLIKLFRSRLRGACHNLGVARTQRSHTIVGCPWATFVAHIEAKMTWWNARHGPEEQMTWLNTHRDHIKPISLATSEEEIRALHHYTNYQPLLWRDNLVKGTRWGGADEAAWAARIYLHPEFEEVYLPAGI